jgi:hypothetical protein
LPPIVIIHLLHMAEVIKIGWWPRIIINFIFC